MILPSNYKGPGTVRYILGGLALGGLAIPAAFGLCWVMVTLGSIWR